MSTNIPQPSAPIDAAPVYPPAPSHQHLYAQSPGPIQPASSTNVLAIVSLISSFVVSIAAVITGHIALSQIRRTGENGRGLAIAGLVIGYAGIAFGLIVTFFYGILIIFGLTAGAMDSDAWNSL